MKGLDVRKLERQLNIKPRKEDVFLNLVSQISRLSTGFRRQGAILVKDDEVISSGFFDAYPSVGNPKEDDKERKEKGSGAIENCIASCARKGVCTDGASLYVYSFPNDIQCKLLARAGIREIRFLKDIESTDGKKLCIEKGIKVFLEGRVFLEGNVTTPSVSSNKK